MLRKGKHDPRPELAELHGPIGEVVDPIVALVDHRHHAERWVDARQPEVGHLGDVAFDEQDVGG